MSDYRERAITEYGELCKVCGSGEYVEVHHRDGDRTNNKLDNLIPLCRGCHAQVHGLGLNGLEEELKPVEERAHREVCATLSIKVSDRLHNRICSQLEYGDSKSEFIRDCIRRKLESNPHECDEPIKSGVDRTVSVKLFDGMDGDIRQHLGYEDSKSAFIRSAIKEQLDRLELHVKKTANLSETEQTEVSAFVAESGGVSE